MALTDYPTHELLAELMRRDINTHVLRAEWIVALSRSLQLLDSMGAGHYEYSGKMLADIVRLCGDHFTAGLVRDAEALLERQATE